jgi:predicted phosphodiesterase
MNKTRCRPITKIDYISDFHIDHWVARNQLDYIDSYFVPSILPNECAKTLLIGGDTGSDNVLTAELLRVLSSYYEDVVIVLGNHDGYLISSDGFSSSIDKLIDLRTRIDAIEGVVLLDKETVVIDNITIAGTSGWCDFSYFSDWHDSAQMGKLYYESLNDLHRITPDFLGLESSYNNKYLGPRIEDFSFAEIGEAVLQLADKQKEALRKLSKKADILLTHYPGDARLVSKKWASDPATQFFFMDGSDFDLDGKIWVSGHTHDSYEIELDGVRYLNNAYGYPGERLGLHHSDIKSFEM